MKQPICILFAAAAMIGLSAGTGGAATKIQKTFGSWQVECNESDQGQKVCGLFTAYINSQNKAVVLSWTIAHDEKSDSDKLVVRTLTGVDVSQGISVQFGDAKPVIIPYKICMPEFCAAEVPFSDAWLQALKMSGKFPVIYKAANGAEVKQEVDLKGFGEGYEFFISQLKS